MNRIDTDTVDDDLHGTGKDGFTDGDPGMAIAPTRLNAKWFNSAQEEIARCVEANGVALDEDNYSQTDDAVQGMSRAVAAHPTARYVLQGLTFDISGTSLSTTLAAGEFVHDGRRYIITSAKLTAAGFASWGPLTASRDHYFYLAPEDPDAPATPPNRTTVYVERLDVANGAGAPATPTGTFLFAVLVTNGTDITSVTYYARGPRLHAENGASVELRPTVGGTAASLRPSAANLIDLGYTVGGDSNEGHFGTAYVHRMNVRTTVSALNSMAKNERYTVFSTTTGGGTTDVPIPDVSELLLADGACAYVECKGVGFNPTDPTDSYAFRNETIVKYDGALSLEGAGGPDFEDGNEAVVDGVSADYAIVSQVLNLRLTGHTTDSLRWFYEVHVIIGGEPA